MQSRHKKLKILIILLIFLVLAGGITGGVLYVIYRSKGSAEKRQGIGAIASNGVECAEMGKKIFEKGGNIADVTVTTLLCEGVSSPASCGEEILGMINLVWILLVHIVLQRSERLHKLILKLIKDLIH